MLPAIPDRPFDCNDVERLGHAYLDDEFDAADRDLIEAHLAACGACREELAAAADFRRFLRQRLREEVLAPPALRTRICEKLEQEDRGNILALAWKAWPSLALGASAAACLGLVYARTAPRASDRWVVNDAVEMHARALPLEVSTDELRRLMPFFDQHLPFAVQPPAFSSPVLLEGGRLWHLGSHDAAYILYGVPLGPGFGPVSQIGRRVSLFIVEDPSPTLRIDGARVAKVDGHDVLLTSMHGHNVAVWRNRDVVYSMVSDLDDNEILGLLGANSQSALSVSVAQ
jgi:anti-sigma factor (TIGR02949 family)